MNEVQFDSYVSFILVKSIVFSQYRQYFNIFPCSYCVPMKCWSLKIDLYVLAQGRENYGPRAVSGPFGNFIRPPSFNR